MASARRLQLCWQDVPFVLVRHYDWIEEAAGEIAAGGPVVNRFVDLLLGHNEIAIRLILRHKREDVEEVGVPRADARAIRRAS